VNIKTTHAAGPTWQASAACAGADTEAFYADDAPTQRTAQAVCRNCPARTACLTDALAYDQTGYMVWGVAGGLTPHQRRSLRVEQLLGNVPDTDTAALLAGPGWADVMDRLKELPPAWAAVELRGHGFLTSAVTARLALWWCGHRGSLLKPKQRGDVRQLWERVHDESRDVVDLLSGMGVGRRDVAAYLMVSEDALWRATCAWRALDAAAAEEVAA
jgi:hypothetical protein